MRVILAFVLAFIGAANTIATDVYFNLSDYNAFPATNRIVSIQFMTPTVGNLWYTNTGPTNSFWYSNFPQLTLANVIIKAPPAPISLQFFIPSTNFTAGWSSTNFTASGSASTYPAAQVAPSFQAAFALFAPNGSVQTNLFYPLGNNPSNYVQLPSLGLYANTNGYIPGANVTFTTNAGVVTIASTGAGSATNAINIINGAGSGTQLTNSTLLGSVTATNLDARYDSAGAATVATNGLGTMAQASTNSYVLTNALLAITNTVVTSATNAAAAIALNATNAAVITSTNLSASMIQNSTNKALATATNSFDALGVATIVSNGVTTAWQAGTNQLQANLNGTNGVMVANIFNSTNNLWVPLNQGPFYDTNTLIVSGTGSIVTGVYTNDGTGVYFNNSFSYVTNAGTVYQINGSAYGGHPWTNAAIVGSYQSSSSPLAGTNTYINYKFLNLQPANSNITNWGVVNTNSIGTYWPTMTQLNTASNGLQSQITAGGVNGLTVTNISSNTVYQATNGFGNIVTQNLPGFTNNLVSSSTNAIQGVFNTLITGPTNSAVQSATNFSGLVTAAVIKLATNGTLQVGTNSFLLSISAGTNIIGLNYGADGNLSYKLSAASTWTNSFDSRYTLNQAGGILSANSNGSQLALISWVNIPVNGTATNMAVGSSGASPAPVIAFGRTNQVNGQIIGGNAEITASLVVQSNITIGGTYTGNGTGVTNTQAGSLNPAGVTQSYTNAVAASQVTITNPVTVGGVTHWIDLTGIHQTNAVPSGPSGVDTNGWLVGNPVTQIVTNAQGIAATNIPQSSLYSSNSAQLGGNLPSYYAPASNTVSTVVDSNGVYTVSGTNAPFAFPGGVGSSIPVQAVFVISGRSAYNNTWFTNAGFTPNCWQQVGNIVRYITNVNGLFVIGGGAGGAWIPGSGGAATNGSLFGFYQIGGYGGSAGGDTTASNTFVYAYPQMSAGMYLPNNTNPPPPLLAIPAGGCFIQCSNSEVWFIFNTNATEISVHLP